jgi:hypothetical protein
MRCVEGVNSVCLQPSFARTTAFEPEPDFQLNTAKPGKTSAAGTLRLGGACQNEYYTHMLTTAKMAGNEGTAGIADTRDG